MNDVDDHLLSLHGGDPFEVVRTQGERHQRAHRCGLHDAGPSVMHVVAHFAKCAGARRVLDLGCGLGYWADDTLRSAQHLSEREDLDVAWIPDPPLGVAVKRSNVR